LHSILNHQNEIDYDKLEQLAQAIISRRIALGRFNPKEERGRIEGGSLHARASIILGADRSTNRSQYDSLTQKEINLNQEKLLTKFAQRTGCWLREKDIADSALKQLQSGSESDVFLLRDEDFVVKLTDYNTMSASIEEFLDNRITLHNYLFSDTCYTLLGFTETAVPFGGFRLVVKQPFIHGKTLLGLSNRDPVQAEYHRSRLAQFMKQAFDLDQLNKKAYYNSNYVVDDLHLANVIQGDDDQRFYFIDPVPYLNTPKDNLGGVRKYDSGDVFYF
jgi:hypothetical protein